MENCIANVPGGGAWGVGAGQTTDDSELSTCLMLGIIDSNLKKDSNEIDEQEEYKVNFDKVILRYRDWYKSEPFDCGITVRVALEIMN